MPPRATVAVAIARGCSSAALHAAPGTRPAKAGCARRRQLTGWGGAASGPRYGRCGPGRPARRQHREPARPGAMASRRLAPVAEIALAGRAATRRAAGGPGRVSAPAPASGRCCATGAARGAGEVAALASAPWRLAARRRLTPTGVASPLVLSAAPGASARRRARRRAAAARLPATSAVGSQRPRAGSAGRFAGADAPLPASERTPGRSSGGSTGRATKLRSGARLALRRRWAVPEGATTPAADPLRPAPRSCRRRRAVSPPAPGPARRSAPDGDARHPGCRACAQRDDAGSRSSRNQLQVGVAPGGAEGEDFGLAPAVGGGEQRARRAAAAARWPRSRPRGRRRRRRERSTRARMPGKSAPARPRRRASSTAICAATASPSSAEIAPERLDQAAFEQRRRASPASLPASVARSAAVGSLKRTRAPLSSSSRCPSAGGGLPTGRSAVESSSSSASAQPGQSTTASKLAPKVRSRSSVSRRVPLTNRNLLGRLPMPRRAASSSTARSPSVRPRFRSQMLTISKAESSSCALGRRARRNVGSVGSATS